MPILRGGMKTQGGQRLTKGDEVFVAAIRGTHLLTDRQLALLGAEVAFEQCRRQGASPYPLVAASGGDGRVENDPEMRK